MLRASIDSTVSRKPGPDAVRTLLRVLLTITISVVKVKCQGAGILQKRELTLKGLKLNTPIEYINKPYAYDGLIKWSRHVNR